MIKVLLKACDILELLGETPERAVRLGEITERLGLNAGTCANILKTMVARGLAVQDGPKRGYRIGPLVHRLSARAPLRPDVAVVARPIIERRAEAIGELVLVAAMQAGRREILCAANGNRTLQVRPEISDDGDSYETATGRLLLACLPADQLEAYIAGHGLPGSRWPGARDERGLRRRLTEIGEASLAINGDRPELVQLAAPIRQGGDVVAAAGLAVPESRWNEETAPALEAALRDTAREITDRLTNRLGRAGEAKGA